MCVDWTQGHKLKYYSIYDSLSSYYKLIQGRVTQVERNTTISS